jgi:hypothetical protein
MNLDLNILNTLPVFLNSMSGNRQMSTGCSNDKNAAERIASLFLNCPNDNPL